LQHIQWVLKFKLDKTEANQNLIVDLYNALNKKLSHSKTASMEVLILSVMLPLLSSDKVESAIKWFKEQSIPLQDGKEI